MKRFSFFILQKQLLSYQQKVPQLYTFLSKQNKYNFTSSNEQLNLESKLKKLDNKLKIFVKENKYYECLDLYKQKLQILNQNKEANQSIISKVLIQISQYYIFSNNYKEGNKNFELALQLCIKNNLRDDKLALYNTVAGAFMQVGKFDQAVNLYKEALQLSKIIKGELSNETGVCLLNLAKSQFKINNRDFEIFKYYEEAKNIYEFLLKATPPNQNDKIIAFKKNLGLVLEEIGSLKLLNGMKAKSEFEQVLQIYSEVYDQKSQFLILPLMEIGNAYQQEGNFENAVKLQLAAIQIAEQNEQSTSPLTFIQLLLGSARSYSELKMYKESIEQLLRLEKLLEFVKDESGGNLSMKAMIKGHLGFLYIQSTQLDLAKVQIQKGIEISKGKFESVYGILLCQHAFVLLNLDKQYAEAFESAKKSYEIIQSNDKNKKNPNLGDCLRIMGLSCIELGQKEQAKQYLTDALNILIDHSERKEDALKIKSEIESISITSKQSN